MAMIKCPQCGKDVSSAGRLCSHCGAALGQPSARPMSRGTKVAVGCAIAAAVGFVLLAVVGMLAAIAIPSFIKARGTSQTHACINHLRMIDAAKEQWAMEKDKRPGDPVFVAQVNDYLKGGMTPSCPAGGTYTYGPVGQPPTCSIAEHALSGM